MAKTKNSKMDVEFWNTLEMIKKEHNLASNTEAQRFLNTQFKMVGNLFEGVPKKNKKNKKKHSFGLEGYDI